MLLKPVLLSLAAFAPAVYAQCKQLHIPVTVSDVGNVVFDPTLDLTTVGGVESALSSGVGLLGQILTDLLFTVHGKYFLAAKYCPPAADSSGPAARTNHLQVLLHGFPYNNTYWFGLPGNPDPDDEYSWVDYATSQGYPVLVVDNLGHGLSQRADPITEVQQPLQTALIHGLTTLLRNGNVTGVPQPSKVIFVGHGVGSVIGNGIASRWPKDFDAMILTGYTYDFVPAAVGLLTELLVPASVQNPVRHPADTYPPGYLAFNSSDSKRQTYYAEDGSFDPDVALYDYNVQDTLSLGEVVTAFSGLQQAPAYNGSVFVLTGEQDAFFCGPTGTRVITTSECGLGSDGLPAKSVEFFPNATNFHSYVVQDVAHAFNLHFAGYEAIQLPHIFLTRWGF